MLVAKNNRKQRFPPSSLVYLLTRQVSVLHLAICSQKEGICSFTNCKYSHHPSDIKIYLELDKHKDFLGGVIKTSRDKAKTSVNISYSQATTGAKGNSPGVKPNYGSILRASGSVTR